MGPLGGLDCSFFEELWRVDLLSESGSRFRVTRSNDVACLRTAIRFRELATPRVRTVDERDGTESEMRFYHGRLYEVRTQWLVLAMVLHGFLGNTLRRNSHGSRTRQDGILARHERAQTEGSQRLATIELAAPSGGGGQASRVIADLHRR